MQKRITNLQENLMNVQHDIQRACQVAGRDAKEITLVAVSKTHSVEDIAALNKMGQLDFGENRVQELVEKMDSLEDLDICWHLIGTLQRNKVRFVVGRVALIHSVNTIRLIKEIEKRAKSEGLVQDILLQINVAQEESKHGFSFEEIPEALELLEQCDHIRLRGLMCMAPYFTDSTKAYPIFADLFSEFKKLQARYGSGDISILSMGMSGDYIEAIKAGATHLRIGSSIFGQRG